MDISAPQIKRIVLSPARYETLAVNIGTGVRLVTDFQPAEELYPARGVSTIEYSFCDPSEPFDDRPPFYADVNDYFPGPDYGVPEGFTMLSLRDLRWTPEKPEPVEPEPVDGETLVYRRYVELGVIARDAEAERKKIRAEEIEPMMESGIVFGEGNRMLVFEHSVRTDFDWQRARADGVIPDAVWKEYASLKVVRTLSDRKRDEDGRHAEQQKLRLMSRAGDLQSIAEALLGDLRRYVEQDEATGAVPAAASAGATVEGAKILLTEILRGTEVS